MKHSYPIDRKQTFYYKHAEPVLKAFAIMSVIGFLVLLVLSFVGRI